MDKLLLRVKVVKLDFIKRLGAYVWFAHQVKLLAVMFLLFLIVVQDFNYKDKYVYNALLVRLTPATRVA